MRILIILVAVLYCSLMFAQSSDVLEPIDIFDMEFVGDPQISPDGSKIVYVRNFKDIMTDGNRSNLWIINSDGTGHMPLTSGSQNDYAPRWSPDGQRLAYISTIDGAPQVYMRWMKEGMSAKVTNLQKSPGQMTWSPDGKWIAMTMSVAEKASTHDVLPTKPEGAKWADAPIYIDQVNYRGDGAGYLDVSFDQIFLLSADGGTPRQITSDPHDHFGIDWGHDSKSIFYASNHHPNWEFEPQNSEIHQIDINSKRIKTLTDRYGPDASPKVSPDGKTIAYLGADDKHLGYQVTKLYLMNTDGSNSRMICDELDRDIENIHWSSDSRSIFFQYDTEGNTHIANTDLSGRITEITKDVGGLSLGRPYSGGTFSISNNDKVAYTYGTPEHPSDLSITDGNGDKRLTSVNADLLDYKMIGKVEEIWYPSSHDGKMIQGWIVKPPNFDPNKKYPLMLEIHGGPFANYGSRFSAEVQLFASKGYVVLYTNPRGSTSYGQDFGNLIHHNYPGEDYDDLISGVDKVIEQGYIDEDQLYVTGGSGGGVLTAWIVGNTERFRAAVVAKPVINWYSFVLYSDNLGFFSKYWFPGKPWDNVEHYMKRSPISLVGNVTTPTMLLTGEQDWRTPISESEQYYAALKLEGVETAMVRIPGASHGIASKPSNLIAKVNSIIKWFKDHAEDEEIKP